MNYGFKPWTSRPQLRMFGIPRKARVLEYLDLTYWKARSHKSSGGLSEAELLGNAFVDISQNPERTYCRSDCVPVDTNLSAIYSYNRDCVLSGGSMLQTMKWIPEFYPLVHCSEPEARSLAGDCFSVPMVALIQACIIQNPYGPWWLD